MDKSSANAITSLLYHISQNSEFYDKHNCATLKNYFKNQMRCRQVMKMQNTLNQKKSERYSHKVICTKLSAQKSGLVSQYN